METLKIATYVFAVLGVVWVVEIICFLVLLIWRIYKDSEETK